MIPSTVTLAVTQGALSGKEYVFEGLARCMIGRGNSIIGRCGIEIGFGDTRSQWKRLP